MDLKQTPGELFSSIISLRNDADKLQDQIYILAGALGGVCALLLLLVIILIIVAVKLNRKIDEAEESRRIAAEINARKFSAYTGEEVHRKLQTTTPAARPGGTNSEYAFNHPEPVSEYRLNSPQTKY